MPADTSGLPGHGLADLFFLDMPDDRRSVRRARLAGVRVTYESASGERKEADVLDLGSGGLFIRTATPIPIGKRLSLEIFVTGEATSWPALGRVLWTREADEGEERPAGMGIKLIDVEDDVIAAIDRLVHGLCHFDYTRRLVVPSRMYTSLDLAIASARRDDAVFSRRHGRISPGVVSTLVVSTV